MGQTNQFESHRNELPALLEFEHDSHVIEYYCQAGKLRLRYTTESGRIVVIDHTPDYLVLTETAVIWVECKLEADLVSLSEQSPNRYVRNPDGSWSCPPGEEAAAKFGFQYRLRSSQENCSELARNINFLDEYFTYHCPEPSNELVKGVTTYVLAHEGLKYNELIESVTNLTADNLNFLISRGIVFADLRRVVLADRESVSLYSSLRVYELIEASTASSKPAQDEDSGIVDLHLTAKIRLGTEELTIIDLSDVLISAINSDGVARHIQRSSVESLTLQGTLRGIRPASQAASERMSRLLSAGPDGQAMMLARYHAIEPYLTKYVQRPRLLRRPTRSIERWMHLYRNAQTAHGCGILGLLPKPRSGNATSRLRPEVEGLIERFIDSHLLTKTNPRITHVYSLLTTECDRLKYDRPSFRTFQRAAASRGIFERKRKTISIRAAYTYAKRYLFIDQLTPVHGDRPWEIGHIDHTQLDIELVSKDGQNLGRPWLTILIDAYSRRILAISVSFFPPSSQACMRILRTCVKRHHRLPQTIVVDNGKEFNSTYFELLLAMYRITKKSRPPAKARFGTLCERIFGTVNSQFVHNLQGNTKVTKNVRQVTASSNPKNLAIWTLRELTLALQRYCYETYEVIQHKTLGDTPRSFYDLAMQRAGERRHVYIAFDETFYIVTLPSTKSGFATIDPKNGVRIQYIDYWNDIFAEAEIAGERVPVRIDSGDIAIAYAFVKQRWVRCIASNSHLFTNCDMRTAEIAAEELKRKRRLHDKKRQITCKELAEQLKALGDTEAMLLHLKRLNDSREANKILMGESFGDAQGGNPPPSDNPKPPSVSKTASNFASMTNDEEVA
jgi:transposase InsO family protein